MAAKHVSRLTYLIGNRHYIFSSFHREAFVWSTLSEYRRNDLFRPIHNPKLAPPRKLLQNVATSVPQSIERRIVTEPDAQSDDHLALGDRPIVRGRQLGLERASPAASDALGGAAASSSTAIVEHFIRPLALTCYGDPCLAH